MADVPISGTLSGSVPFTGTLTGSADITNIGGGGTGGGNVFEGLDGASQSFPAISGFAGYMTIYVDPAGMWRSLPAGFASELTLFPNVPWPPGYRISDGVSIGGVYPAAGTLPTGTELIRLQPPVSGVNRVTFVSLVKAVVQNPNPTATSFQMALGVAHASQDNYPMNPYLGYAHDQATVLQFQETLAPGETRQHVIFRADTVDNGLNGNRNPNWPSWTMDLARDGTLLYPSVDIECVVGGPVGINVGGIFAVGLVL